MTSSRRELKLGGTWLTLISVAFSLGCKSNKVVDITPSIQVTDTQGTALSAIDFPPTAFQSVASFPFLVSSLSAAPLQISGMQISGPQAGLFQVTSDAGFPITLQQSQSAAFTAIFSPVVNGVVDGGTVQETATLSIANNDPQHSPLALPLDGPAAPSALDLCWVRANDEFCLSQGPVNINFGSVPLGYQNTSQPAVIQVLTTSEVPLQLRSVGLDAEALDAGFQLVQPIPALPVPLAKGQTPLQFFVALFPHGTLQPGQSFTVGGHLLVESDDPHYPPDSPPDVTLAATVVYHPSPVACLELIDYTSFLTGKSSDGGDPAPLDTASFTAQVSPTCSYDSADGTNLEYAFLFPDGGTPPGSVAQLHQPSTNAPQASVQFDRVGGYEVTVIVKDSVNLSAQAVVPIEVRPRQDLAAQLTWSTPGVSSTVPAELDLHLVRVRPDAGVDGGVLGVLEHSSGDDCYWGNCMRGSSGSLNWGSPNDPAFETHYGQQSAPLPQSPEDLVGLTTPQPGDSYDLFVWYSQVTANGGGCQNDSQCAALGPGYAHCVQNFCAPVANADLGIYVEGNGVSDGGPLSISLDTPCQLWHAGTVQWIAGGQLADGGFSPANFTFTPATGSDGGSDVLLVNKLETLSCKQH